MKSTCTDSMLGDSPRTATLDPFQKLSSQSTSNNTSTGVVQGEGRRFEATKVKNNVLGTVFKSVEQIAPHENWKFEANPVERPSVLDRCSTSLLDKPCFFDSSLTTPPSCESRSSFSSDVETYSTDPSNVDTCLSSVAVSDHSFPFDATTITLFTRQSTDLYGIGSWVTPDMVDCPSHNYPSCQDLNTDVIGWLSDVGAGKDEPFESGRQ